MSPDFSAEDHGLLPDLFHALNQPLTSLHCCLELCLQPSNQMDKRTRRNLRLALRQIDSAILLAKGIRELADPRHIEVIPEAIDLGNFLREMAAELVPLAEIEGKKLTLNFRLGCTVNFAAGRLRESLFRLLTFAIAGARAGTSINLSVEQKDETAKLTIRFTTCDPAKTRNSKRVSAAPQALQDRLNLSIARRILADAGCVFEMAKTSNGYSLELRLPLAAQEPALPLTRSFRRRA